MIHLLIADDHLLFRETLRRDLASEPDMLVVGVATSRDQVATLLSQALIDIVLLNLKLDTYPTEGLEIAAWIREQSPATEVILLAGAIDAELQSKAQKAGAAGLISKATDQETLLRTIRRVYRGESWVPTPDIPPSDSEHSFQRLPAMAFTATERKVLQLLSQGNTLSQIATSLSHRLHTIEVHRRNLLAKFGVFKDADLLAAAAEEGLLDEGPMEW